MLVGRGWLCRPVYSSLETDQRLCWDSFPRGARKWGSEKGVNETSSLLPQSRRASYSPALLNVVSSHYSLHDAGREAIEEKLVWFRAHYELSTVLSTLCASPHPTLTATFELGLVITPFIKEVKEPCSTSVLCPRTYTENWLSQDLKHEQSDSKPGLFVNTLNLLWGEMQMENTLIDFWKRQMELCHG